MQQNAVRISSCVVQRNKIEGASFATWKGVASVRRSCTSCDAIGAPGVLMPLAESSAVPLEHDGVRIAEDLSLPAGDGVAHGGTALPQHLL
jgi:hypothetical protein